MKCTVRSEIADRPFGFIDHKRVRPGDVFTVADEPRRDLFPGEKKLLGQDPERMAIYDRIRDRDGRVPQLFSFRWMLPVDELLPEKVSTAQESMNQRSEQIKLEKAGARAVEGSAKDVI